MLVKGIVMYGKIEVDDEVLKDLIEELGGFAATSHVCKLYSELFEGVSRPTMKRILEESGVVSCRRVGRYVIWYVDD